MSERYAKENIYGVSIAQFRAALAAGFEIRIRSTDGVKLQAGNLHIWKIRDGWQTAELIDGLFANHKTFSDLIDALHRWDSSDAEELVHSEEAR